MVSLNKFFTPAATQYDKLNVYTLLCRFQSIQPPLETSWFATPERFLDL